MIALKVKPESNAYGALVQNAGEAKAPMIHIAGLEKSFKTRSGETVNALTNVNIDIQENEFISVVGPSGCGKTTLLRILAGLESASSGVIQCDQTRITGPRPDVGVVFQQATLLPWNTVLTNVLLSAHLKNDRSQATVKRAERLLAFMGLKDFAQKYPFELSGGMQQRVSICRALMREPRILLMDEPFGALDAMTREAMNMELSFSSPTAFRKRFCSAIVLLSCRRGQDEYPRSSTSISIVPVRCGRWQLPALERSATASGNYSEQSP
jgi:NitT/TauT family transport system ATP-binding protein